MPTGMGEEERFAAALDGTTSVARIHGGDPVAHDLEIVALLRSGAPALAPDPVSRQRAKQRLMAAFAQEFGHDARAAVAPPGSDDPTGPLQVVMPVALADRPEPTLVEPAPVELPATGPAPTPLRRGGRHSVPEVEPVPEAEPDEGSDVAEGNVRRLRPGRTGSAERGGHRRAALLGAAAAAALVALAGTSTFASQDALPGDSMYGVKRAAESTGLALTFGEQAKARRHLEQAQQRLDEVQGMVARGNAAPAAEPQLVRSTMQQFNTETSEGSQQLLSGPKPTRAEVDEVRTWATQQSQKLSQLRAAMPEPDQADQSLALLNQLIGVTSALQGTACDASGSATGCTPAAPAPDTTRAHAPATPGVRASTSSSGTGRHSSGSADNGSGNSGSAGSDRPQTSKGTSSSDDADDSKKTHDRDSGDSGGSGGGGGVDVPLPVPAPQVNVPSVAGLPSVHLGGN